MSHLKSGRKPLLILDDLAKIVLEGITAHINRSYLVSLKNNRKGLLLLYEQGEISESEFRVKDEKLRQMIKQLTVEIENSTYSNTISMGW